MTSMTTAPPDGERPSPDEWLTPGQAAMLAGVSARHLARLADSGAIRAERDGDGPRRYDAASVRTYAARELLERFAIPATDVFAALADADGEVALNEADARNPDIDPDDRLAASAAAECGRLLLANLRARLAPLGVMAA